MLYIYIQYTVYVVGALAAIKSKVLIVSFQQEESDFCLFILCLVILLISETQTFWKVTIGPSFCMNFFLYLLVCMNFFSWHFPLHEFFFDFSPTPPPPHHFSNGPFFTSFKELIQEIYRKRMPPPPHPQTPLEAWRSIRKSLSFFFLDPRLGQGDFVVFRTVDNCFEY